jgi:hypothetical protein
MSTLTATARKGVWFACAAFWAASALHAQPPQQGPQNLQVFPKDISRQDLIQNMRLFNQALGVQCDHCHVGREFAKDEKPAKNVARAMIRMVHDLKENADKYLPEGREAKAACWTCHRGNVTVELPKPPEPGPPGGGKKGGAPKAEIRPAKNAD